MCNACGLVVNCMRANRGRFITFPQSRQVQVDVYMEKLSLIPTLHIFYTHIFAQVSYIFQSVICNLYTFYTRLIITKTMYI